MVRETASRPPQTANINGCSKKAGTSGLNDGSMDIYDSEAAQNAFFNAPKISRRQFVNKRVSKKGGDGAGTDEEGDDTEQPYDENNDQELNARIAGFMQEFISKKINANNAFETQILEKLNNVVEVESLQCVGTMLDASARVYAFRVDNTHGECFTVRTTIDESKKKKGATNDDPRNMKTVDENGEAVNNPGREGDSAGPAQNDDDDEDNNAVAEENERLKKAKQKKARQKESKLAEQNGQVEDLLKATSLTQRFAAICLPDEAVDEESVTAGFDHYINEMDALSTLRRVKIPFINERAGNIDRTNEEYGIDDPIYHKVAKEFEEGCAQSFVNNEVLTNPDGCFLILHTNWKNDEPNIPPQPTAFSTKLDPIFDQLEGSLERALAPQPCNLNILQDFCEEDSDGGDNQSDEIRLLGRRSQTVKQVTQRQLPESSTRDPSVENDVETESVVSMTEEEKARKAHEELAKFQMLLDDEDEQPVKKDPFDGENFFNNDFSELLHPDEESELQKATFHTISDEDAIKFGIPSDLMARIRMSLKSQRLLSEELQEQLFDTIGPENRARLEVVLDTKDLTKKEVAKPGTEVNQPLDYFMTRFAPLIDSVWHATIKKASEDQLSKVGFNFGSKGLQRITMRLGASAMKSVTKRRRGPYVTPVKTPARATPLGTPESRTISPQSMTNSSRLSTRRDQFSSARKKAVSRLKFPGAASTGKKNRRSAHHEISDEENVDVDMSPVSKISRVSETIAQSKSYVYFWARPREYPRVYLEQVLDEKDNPMQTADLLDMDDVLGLNEDARNKRITLTNQTNNDSTNFEPMDDTPAMIAEETLQPVNDPEPIAAAQADDSFNQSIDFGDLQQDIDENINEQAEAAETEVVQLAEKTLENTDILNILNPPAESIAGELLDPDEPVVEAIIVNAPPRQEPQIEDDSHWKGGSKAVAGQLMAQETEALKKAKKTVPSKPKRQRLDFNVSEDEEMNWDLESATPIEKVKALKSQHKAALLTKLPEEGKVDIVGSGSVKLADMYDPVDLINRSLLYKRKSGYWKNTANGSEYVKLRSGYAMRSVEEEHRECVSALTVISSKKKKRHNDEELRTAQRNNLINLQEVFGVDMEEDAGANFYDIDISPRQLRSASSVDGRVLCDEKDEQMEFNGGIIKIRQTRVKAPMVKRAITSVLASKQTDVNAMQLIMESSPVKNRAPDGMEEDSDSNGADNDAYSDESDPEEEGETIAGRQSGSLNGTTAYAGFKIQGEHHFSNLCAYLPEYLSGRTKLDLNVINTFAITLHMCNEHSLRLVQEVDPETKLVAKDAMADFKIELAKQ